MSTETCEQINSIGDRLREVRNHLSLSQADLGEIFGVDRKVVGNYEENKTSPRADQLISFQSRGADIVYILTGQRAPLSLRQESPSYSPAERLAESIRTLKLSEEDAGILRELALRLAQ